MRARNTRLRRALVMSIRARWTAADRLGGWRMCRFLVWHCGVRCSRDAGRWGTSLARPLSRSAQLDSQPRGKCMLDELKFGATRSARAKQDSMGAGHGEHATADAFQLQE